MQSAHKVLSLVKLIWSICSHQQWMCKLFTLSAPELLVSWHRVVLVLVHRCSQKPHFWLQQQVQLSSMRLSTAGVNVPLASPASHNYQSRQQAGGGVYWLVELWIASQTWNQKCWRSFCSILEAQAALAMQSIKRQSHSHEFPMTMSLELKY